MLRYNTSRSLILRQMRTFQASCRDAAVLYAQKSNSKTNKSFSGTMPYIMVRSYPCFYEIPYTNQQNNFHGTTFVYGEQNDDRNLETTMLSLPATRLTPTDPSAAWCSYKTSQPPFHSVQQIGKPRLQNCYSKRQ